MEKDGAAKQRVSHQHGHATLLAKQGGWDNKMVLAILYPVFVLDKKVFNPSRWNNVQRQGNLFLCLFSQVNALF
jgi:hypothetical protein